MCVCEAVLTINVLKTLSTVTAIGISCHESNFYAILAKDAAYTFRLFMLAHLSYRDF